MAYAMFWSENVTFEEGIPNHCPPLQAEGIANEDVFYRAVAANEVTNDDFCCWVKSGLRAETETDCRYWGLSVWRELEAVHHGRRVTPSLAEKYVAEGYLGPDDGVWSATPTKHQPKHCTLWKDRHSNLCAKFKVILSPVPGY